MEIFQGDTSKIDRLNELLCEKAGFPATYEISTQTYSRKVDLRVANALSSFGATAMRICTVRLPLCFFLAGKTELCQDIRHLAHDKVLDEPHEATQVSGDNTDLTVLH